MTWEYCSEGLGGTTILIVVKSCPAPWMVTFFVMFTWLFHENMPAGIVIVSPFDAKLSFMSWTLPEPVGKPLDTHVAARQLLANNHKRKATSILTLRKGLPTEWWCCLLISIDGCCTILESNFICPSFSPECRAGFAFIVDRNR
jgi:hypothetical protein